MVISAPSGGGKSAVRSGLLKLDKRFAFSVTCTTRPKRPGEKEGRDYYFVSAREFERRRISGRLLEWASVHGNLYGTPVKSVRDLLAKGLIPVMTIDVKGARSVKKIFPETVSVFLLPPDLKTLVQRLKKRGEAPENIALRLATARKEIKVASCYDYLVINDKLNEAVREVAAIAGLEILKVRRNLEKVSAFGRQLSASAARDGRNTRQFKI
ncbi:MAG: guanylate kinase [Elusimicrobia bacterium]|nr:guanylate kinase [Elusimicrobiota bacterium]